MRRRAWLGLLTAAAGAGAGLSLLFYQPPASNPVIDVKAALANYPLVTQDGNSAKLPGLGSRTLLLNFWATWCPPCRHELPLLEQVYSAGNHQIIALAVDEVDTVDAYLNDNPLEVPVVIAGISGGVRLSSDLGNVTQAMPYTVLISKDGALVASKLGPFANTAEIEQFMLQAN